MPTPPTQDRVTIRRVLPWVILAGFLIFGIVLYFVFGTRVTPLAGTTR
jgi:hypothetical protein